MSERESRDLTTRCRGGHPRGGSRALALRGCARILRWSRCHHLALYPVSVRLDLTRAYLVPALSLCSSLQVSTDLDLVASVSPAGGLVLHSLIRGRFLRVIPQGGGDRVVIGPGGVVLVWDSAERVLSPAW